MDACRINWLECCRCNPGPCSNREEDVDHETMERYARNLRDLRYQAST